MTTTADTARTRSGTVRAEIAAAVVLVAEVVVLAVIVAMHRAVRLPVTVDLPSGRPDGPDTTPRVVLAHVDLGWAVVVVVALVVVARVAAVVAARSGRTVRGIEAVLVAPIAVFLVAACNGITDVGALVLTYAAVSAAVLLVALQGRTNASTSGGRPSMAPMSLAAALGIVPWGVIAFHQVGAGLVGGAVPGTVRVLTLVVLATMIVGFALTWRAERRMHGTAASAAGARSAAALGRTLVTVLGTSAAAWIAVVGLVVVR